MTVSDARAAWLPSFGRAFLWGCLVLIAVAAAPRTAAAQNCGGHLQRACCLFESTFGPCRDGLTEVNGCDDVGEVVSADCGCSNSHCKKASPCGGEGQRACCGGETVNGEPCAAGLIQIPGCHADGIPDVAGETGNCFCGGEANPFNSFSTGFCVDQSPCGARGQRACCKSERFFLPCDIDLSEALVEVPGCSGDCFCKNGTSSGMCTVLESIVEPQTNRISPPHDAPTTASTVCPLYGYADLHLHLFADMAHGGAVLAGKPYAPVADPYGKIGINLALEQDFTSSVPLVLSSGQPLTPPAFGTCPGYVDTIDPNNGCAETFFHGAHDFLAGDPIGSVFGTQDGANSNLGVPIFNGWPRWSSTTHQQTYYTWLERAWQGGLRLITMLAVTNEALCRGSKRLPGVNCLDSMKPIDDQIAEAKRFESFIDEMYGADHEDKGWFRIVTTPLQARQVVAQGKLAVVLGIEVAELFNCKFPQSQCAVNDGFIANGSCNFSAETNGRKPEGSPPEVVACTPDYIGDQVQKYYDLGVRHVFPIHNFDNAFGGAATWQDGIEVGNRVVEGHWWETRNCFREDYGFALGFFTQTLISLLKFDEEVGATPIRFPLLHADCNQFGLFPLGRVLIEELMDKGMIIDVDHVSNNAFDDILDIAEARDPPYPVVATHVLSFDLHEEEVRHERHRTKAQLERIRGVGGMIAAMLKDEVQDTGRKGERQTVDYAPAEVRDTCRYSSKTFAQAYAYAVDVMGGPVALGSDFNGVAGHFGPRFGNEACGGDIVEQMTENAEGNRLSYPFTISGFGTFDKQVTGDKTFDYNVDGMAHIGLLPDFVADLKKIGVAQSDLDMLFRSAEYYVRVWERSAGVTPAADAPACRQCSGIAVGPSPFYSETTLFFSPAGLATLGTRTVSWNFGDGGTGTGTSVSHRYDDPGMYTVRVTVSDQFGSSECVRQLTVLDNNDSTFGAQLAIDAPDEVLEGTSVPVNFRHSLLWRFDDPVDHDHDFGAVTATVPGAVCGATGVRTQVNTGLNEHDMTCFYPGGLERDEEISVIAVPLAFPISASPASRQHTIRVLNRPPAIVADPIPGVPWGTEMVHEITLDDVAGDVLELKVMWGDNTSETFSGLSPGAFELRHTYAVPSRRGTPYRIELMLSDDVATVSQPLFVEVLGTPPNVALNGPLRTSVGGSGRYDFSASDADGGRAQLGAVSCGDASEEAIAAVINNVPPNPIQFIARCNFVAASSSNQIVVTMIDDEQDSASKTLDVMVGVPPTGEVIIHSAPDIVPPGTAVRFLANGFATEGDPITVELVTCNGEEVPNPIILTFDEEQKFVDFTCTAPDLDAANGAAIQGALATTLVAAVTFSDFDGAASFQAEVGVADATPTATATATGTLSTATATATATGTLSTATATATATPTGTLPTPTSTATATPTGTLPTPTSTATATGTLPTATATPTGTLPTATSTATATLPTATATPTGTLPTATPLGTPQPLGAPCASPGECVSGFCSDGVCCDDACAGALERCDLPGDTGACTAVPAPVPTLTWRGLFVAVVLLLGTAWRAYRRRR